MNLPTSFGLWLKERRKLLGLTQAELAGRVGCTAATIRKIEAEERRPSRQVAELLATTLHIPAEQHSLFLQIARRERRVDRLGAVSPIPNSVPHSQSKNERPGRETSRRGKYPTDSVAGEGYPGANASKELRGDCNGTSPNWSVILRVTRSPFSLAMKSQD